MRKLFALRWLLVVMAMPMLAQQTAVLPATTVQTLPSDVPSRELVLKTFVHPEDVRKNVENLFAKLKQQLRQRVQSEGNADPARLKFMEDMMDSVVSGISPDDVLNAEVAVYQRLFTVEDLNALSAFLESPAGKKLSNQQEMFELMMQAMDPQQRTLLEAKPLPSDAPKPEQIRRLFDAMQMRANMVKMIDSMGQQSKAAAQEVLRQKGMNPGEASTIVDRHDDDPSVDRAIDATLLVYQRYFSAQEIEALAAFYLSPVGQKQISALPEISDAAAKAMVPSLRKIMQTVFEKMKEYDEQTRNKSGLINPNRSFYQPRK